MSSPTRLAQLKRSVTRCHSSPVLPSPPPPPPPPPSCDGGCFVSDAMLTELITNSPERLLRTAHLAHLLRVGVQRGLLPVSQPPGSFAGLNSALRPRVPKRSWQRGTTSNSLSRHTQHQFMWRFVDSHGPRLRARAESEGRKVRCLDWDGWYGGSVFASVCGEVDVIEYGTPYGQVPPRELHWAERRGALATRWYRADTHSMSQLLDRGVYDLIIANSVFEHLHEPAVAMREVAEVLRPGGYLFWHTPFEFEEHGVPHDYYRYTAAGARLLAEGAGLRVELAEADGGYAAVLSNVFGLGTKFWSEAQLQAVENASRPRHYLSTRMLAVKP